MSTIQIVGLIVVLILTILGGFLIAKKSKKYNLLKWVGLFIFLGVALTWIFGYGYYQGTEFVDAGMVYRRGLTDLPYLVYQAIEYSLDKIVFLLVLGGFYAIMQKSKGYRKLVTKMAEKLKGKEILTVVTSSLIFTALATLLNQSFVALVFVPFVISVLLEMKLDKLTAFSATFGSILIGTLGLTYGNEGLYYFNYYASVAISTGILYRLIVLIVAFILFNFFTVLHAKKVLNEKSKEEVEDPFKVEKMDKDARCWPIAVTFVLMLALLVLGHLRWEESFGITVFNDFHEWLIGLKIGSFEVFKSILGIFSSTTTNGAFGNWGLFHTITILLVVSIVVGLCNKIKLNEFIDNYKEGAKKLALPIVMYVAVYMVMATVYTSCTIPTITNLIFGMTKNFNPFVTSLAAVVTNIFHVDFGLTGYLVGSFLVGTYESSFEILYTIYITLYGFLGLFVPTSGMLLLGLSYLNIDYKSWLKYIWLFVVGILIILLVLFTVMTYI